MPRLTRYPMLVIDAGNSAVKFAVVARAARAPKLLRAVSTAKLTAAMARRAGANAKSVVISSVVPSASRLLKSAFPGARFIGPRAALPIETLVDRKTAGSDRLANASAAHARYGNNVLVASFGTAATFDIIDAKGVHRGGAIAPGWSAFAEIPAKRTALLPRVATKKVSRFIGRNTREALAAGVAGGYAAMVSRLITKMKDEARVKKLRVVFTGGDAAFIAKLTGIKAVSDPLLTLRGIAILAEDLAREASK